MAHYKDPQAILIQKLLQIRDGISDQFIKRSDEVKQFREHIHLKLGQGKLHI